MLVEKNAMRKRLWFFFTMFPASVGTYHTTVERDCERVSEELCMMMIIIISQGTEAPGAHWNRQHKLDLQQQAH
jgi:hypothetical protein